MIAEPDKEPQADSEPDENRNSRGQFVPGNNANPNGRPPGISDRRAIVRDIITAYHEIGGVEYLKQLAVDHPGLYTRLVERLIPRQIDITGIQITPESVAEQYAAMQRGGLRRE